MKLLIIGLATWRIGHILAKEDGPFEIVKKIRKLFGTVTDDQTDAEHGTNTLSEGILCIWCNTVWIGLVFSVLFFDIREIVQTTFALSAIAIAFDALLDRFYGIR